MTFRTRFAPSPTGPLHLGHAYSAILAHDMARAQGGAFLLRIEDIDQGRSRSNWEAQIYEDLEWLGLSWEMPVMRQSDRMVAYGAALDQLWKMGLLYPCTCTRADIKAASDAPQEGVPTHGPDGMIYPGTCRAIAQPRIEASRPNDTVLRLDMAKALQVLGDESPIRFVEAGDGPNHGNVTVYRTDIIENVGDIVLARRDMGTSYHLSVVVDDAAQGITDVVRGADLFEATQIHIVLQGLLGLPTPTYHHHQLIRDDAGKRLAKRDDARAVSKFKNDGYTPDTIRELVGLTP